MTRKHRSSTRKSAKSIRATRGVWVGGSRTPSMASTLPPFQKLKEVIARTFTFEPGFVPKRETIFVGLDEDTEPILDERANYVWDGKSKLAFYKAKSYSDGTAVGVDDISLQVASAPFVKCKILVNKQAWNELGQFRCCFGSVTQRGHRDCLNNNYSATFTASRHPSSGVQPKLVFVGKYSEEYLQDLLKGSRQFTTWLNSIQVDVWVCEMYPVWAL